jgi:hypothetical protein
MSNSLLKKSENHPNPSFRRKPESSLLLISFTLINILDLGFRRGDEAFFDKLLTAKSSKKIEL